MNKDIGDDMIRGLYTAATGMINEQRRMDIVTNNLANENTLGYKKDTFVTEAFKDVLTVTINDLNKKGINESIVQMTLGVRGGEIFTNFEQGSLKLTNEPLDLALQGDGFFVLGVMDQQGNITNRYSRDGLFSMTKNGDIVTTDGYYLIGENDEIINIPQGDIEIDQSGRIFANNEYINTIKVVDFEDKRDLIKTGANLYSVPPNTEPVVYNGTVVQGFLEQSNVNPIKEMIDMINITKTYEANQKVIQTVDESLSKVVNEIGKI